MPSPRYIAVVGSGGADADLEVARHVGQLVAEAGAVLVGGGLGGVMATTSFTPARWAAPTG